MGGLLSVEDALSRILARVRVLPAEQIHVAQALERVLAEDVAAAAPIPPFANSAMDGYAVRAADVCGAASDAPIFLTPVLDIPAGTLVSRALGAGEAARIMTGAPLPPGADAVIPVEQTDDRWLPDGRAALPERVAVHRAVAAGENVRAAGEDIRAGQVVLRRGAVLRPQDIGVLVSLGRARIPVIRQPRVAILSTGDELADVDQPLAPGQIHNSNSYMLAGLVQQCGGVPIRLPVARDTLDDVRRRLREALAHAPDFIITSAGVSVGTHDVVRTVVDELGQVDIWRVNVKPGKPLAFGDVGGVPFFGLPGNPVSAMVTFDIFARPALRKAGGADPQAVPLATAVLDEDVALDGRRTYLRVTLSERDGVLIARTTGTQSSGALMSLVLADGLLIIPEGRTAARAGDAFAVRLLRQPARAD
ncbi:MAG: molybdopterin molybdotransferase MoeA [Anaerolineae bacterium]|nr:molybdopterin molybdotransferase MoeA [Anaerolineae bacterium]